MSNEGEPQASDDSIIDHLLVDAYISFGAACDLAAVAETRANQIAELETLVPDLEERADTAERDEDTHLRTKLETFPTSKGSAFGAGDSSMILRSILLRNKAERHRRKLEKLKNPSD